MDLYGVGGMRMKGAAVGRNIFLIGLISIALCGCGYTTHAVLPSGEPSVHVDNFANRIDVTRETSDDRTYIAYRPAMESDITREVINRFIFDGNYQVQGAKNAHFLLKGYLVDFKRDPLRYDDSDNVIEYRVSVVVDIELYDLIAKETVWRENSFAGESSYRTSGQFAKSESVATQEAIKDLARRIVERTVEGW